MKWIIHGSRENPLTYVWYQKVNNPVKIQGGIDNTMIPQANGEILNEIRDDWHQEMVPTV